MFRLNWSNECFIQQTSCCFVKLKLLIKAYFQTFFVFTLNFVWKPWTSILWTLFNLVVKYRLIFNWISGKLIYKVIYYYKDSTAKFTIVKCLSFAFDVHYEQYGFIWPNRYMKRLTVNLYQWICGISCFEKRNKNKKKPCRGIFFQKLDKQYLVWTFCLGTTYLKQ